MKPLVKLLDLAIKIFAELLLCAPPLETKKKRRMAENSGRKAEANGSEIERGDIVRIDTSN